MLDVQLEGKRALIDVRERILKGEHPRNEIFDYVKQAPVGTIVEIHLPHKAGPLVKGLEGFGLSVISNQFGPDHFRMLTVKLNEI